MRFTQRALAAAAFTAWHCASVLWRARAWRWGRLRSDECCVYVNTPKSATGADLRGLQPDLAPEPTPSTERRTQPQGGTP